METSRLARRCLPAPFLTRALAVCWLSASAAVAGIAVDGTSSMNALAPVGDQIAWSHTVGSGGNRILVVGVSFRRPSDTTVVTSVDYGSSPLTFVGAEVSTDGGQKHRAELWYLLAPPAGADTVTVQFSASVESAVGGAASFTGVHPTAPTGAFAGAGGKDGTPSVAVTSAAGEVIVGTISIRGKNSNAISPGAGQAQQWSDQTGNNDNHHTLGGGSTAPGATSVTMSWIVASQEHWAMAAVPLRLAPTAPTTLYLKGDGVPQASLLEQAPMLSVLPNYTPGRDAVPGLYLYKTPNGWSETDPAKYQQWVGAADGPQLDGPVSLTFWSAIKNFNTGKRGVAEAYLLDCASDGSDCSLIAQGKKDIFDWSGGWGSWNQYSIEFGNVSYTVPAGRSLAVKLVAGNDADDDMLFAYDTRVYPSRLTDQAASDIVIDCDFSDWSDAEGLEFDVIDQGGPDDWDNPIRLDLTRFAVSSNTVDSFHVLFGLDDVPPQQATAATLIDTDIDGNVNAALVATLDGSSAAVELYTCDDTLGDGCGNAVLERSYPQSFFCLGSGAGPWDDDSMLEATLPFNDLGFDANDIVLTALVSYAGASLLTAPKDAVFGTSGQDYGARLHFDAKRSQVGEAGPVGLNFLVRRSSDPAAVRTATPHASVIQAPFDDDPGTLSDGQLYCYVVEREGGIPLKLSVTPNVTGDAPRISFDDFDPFSASADAFQSTVSVDLSSIPADGTSFATVTVVPRESDGTPLGAGLDLSLDPLPLAPGVPAGPAEDNLDGSYTVRITSTAVGVGDVEITVEGVVLDARPQVSFTAP